MTEMMEDLVWVQPVADLGGAEAVVAGLCAHPRDVWSRRGRDGGLCEIASHCKKQRCVRTGSGGRGRRGSGGKLGKGKRKGQDTHTHLLLIGHVPRP